MNALRHSTYLAMFFVVSFVGRQAAAQGITVNTNVTVQQIVNRIVELTHYSVSNASFTGLSVQRGFYSGGTSLPLHAPKGVVMATGFATNASGPNNQPTNCFGNEGRLFSPFFDEDIEELFGTGPDSFDVAILEFDIVPKGNFGLTIQFIFASNEYDDGNGNECTQGFTDACAIFITPQGGSTRNVAIVGPPANPTKVSVSTVNSENQSSYFKPNIPGDLNYPPLGYNGVVKNVVMAESFMRMDAWQTYHVKIVVADFMDDRTDSALIIAENGFQH